MPALADSPKRISIVLWLIAVVDAAVLISFFLLLGSTSIVLAGIFGLTLYSCISAAKHFFQRHRTVLAVLVGLSPIPLCYVISIINVYFHMVD